MYTIHLPVTVLSGFLGAGKATLLAASSRDYSRRLVAAQPSNWQQCKARRNGDVAVVSARGLSMARGGRRLFDDIDLDLRPGTITGVLGCSFCGKTSLGNALLGLIPSAGGTVCRASAILPLRFRKLWRVPSSAFARKMTAGNELQALARLQGGDWQRMDRLPGHVSGGKVQRSALMRALTVDSVFLVADEPTSRLGLITRQEVIEMPGEVVREESLAFLVVSHNGELFKRFCGHVVKLDDRPAMARHGN